MTEESKLGDRALRMLLEAEPYELRGQGESETARLVRADPVARAAAARILEGLQELDAALGAVAGVSVGVGVGAGIGAPDHVLPRVLADTSIAPVGAIRTPTRAGRSARRRAALIAWGGLAAAALAGLLLIDRAPVLVPTPDAPPRPLTADLAVESDRPFAVFETRNPNIAVVWLFEEER